jgi:hypothetical protein
MLAKQVHFVRELPMTGVGKVDKKVFAGKLPGRPRADGGIVRYGDQDEKG